jgi:MFS transporter, Spinster family, sphingosine-1-phosphate transporter
MKEAAYKNYLLIVLLFILAFNYVDRLALGLLLQDIKAALHLSDTQLGFLTGLAFAVFYSVMGVPIARWADRGNRVLIISVTTGLWSAAVALCGWATSFLHLLLIRIGVAVGEAGCVPPAHSLIADYFSRAERPRAVAIYMLGAPLSTFIGFFVAGWLNEIYGWRITFMALGVPGLLLSAVVWLTLREPRRAAVPAMDATLQPTVMQVCATLWRNVTFRHLLICFSVKSFFGVGIGNWLPTFFIRSYGLKTGELGTRLAVILGVAGLLGTYWGGALASRHAARNESLQLKALALAFPLVGALWVGIFLSPHYTMALALLGIASVGSAMAFAPVFATIQTLVPNHMRAMSIAVVYLVANLIGMGLGPLVAGALSDAFRPLAGEESLRYALLALCPGYLWAAWHLWRASKTVTRAGMN